MYYLLTFSEDWADEHDVPALECFTEEDYNDWLAKEINLYTRLGNSGEGFSDQFEEYVTGKDFVDAELVVVHEVNKDFYDLFHKADLSDLSLCSIFE